MIGPAPQGVVGTVSAFDDPRGIGCITTDDGVELFFHCTQIADGSRTIAVGTRVAVTVVPGRLGRWEAVGIGPPGAPQPDVGNQPRCGSV